MQVDLDFGQFSADLSTQVQTNDKVVYTYYSPDARYCRPISSLLSDSWV